jgi:phospholipid-transporting ATPase
MQPKVEQKPYPVRINEVNIAKEEVETNRISTSKYKWYNCIPKILVEQFSKMANVYFLLIAFMQVRNSN